MRLDHDLGGEDHRYTDGARAQVRHTGAALLAALGDHADAVVGATRAASTVRLVAAHERLSGVLQDYDDAVLDLTGPPWEP